MFIPQIAESFRGSYFSMAGWLICVLVNRCRCHCFLVSPLVSLHDMSPQLFASVICAFSGRSSNTVVPEELSQLSDSNKTIVLSDSNKTIGVQTRGFPMSFPMRSFTLVRLATTPSTPFIPVYAGTAWSVCSASAALNLSNDQATAFRFGWQTEKK